MEVDGDDVCRICRAPGDEDDAPGTDTGGSEGHGGAGARAELFHPCKCNGSIKFVHEACLVQWLKHSKRKSCEVCGAEYKFARIYAPDAPQLLSPAEFVAGLASRTLRLSKLVLRWVLVVLVWLAMVPLATSWVWRTCFATASIKQSVASLMKRACSLKLLATDCVYGSFLSAAIVFVFLGTASLREYMRQLRNMNPEGNANDHQQEQQQQQQHQRINREHNAHDELELERDVIEGLDGDGDRDPLRRRHHGQRDHEMERDRAFVDALDHHHQNQNNQQQLDMDRIDDVPFEELVGIQGPLLSLFENAVTILLSNLFFLVASVMVPFHIGRACRALILSWGVKPVQSSLEIISKISEISDGIRSDAGLAAAHHDEGPGLSSINVLKAASEFEAQLDTPDLADVLTLGAGYLAVLAFGVAFGFIYVFVRFLRTYTRMQHDRNNNANEDGLANGNASITLHEMLILIPFVAKRAVSYIAYSCVLLKVTFLLLIELGVFPLAFGVWLDLCTLPLFGSNPSNRAQFVMEAPLTCTLMHWVIGIVYMFLVCIGVSALREILKPGVLSFLRDPADPNINPFRELFEESLVRHIKRIVLGSLIYGTAAMIVVYMPVQLVNQAFPDALPITIKLVDPISELPLHLLMIHFGLPLAVQYLRPKKVMRVVIHSWLRAVCKSLNVESEILQPAEPAAGHNDDGGSDGSGADDQQATASAMPSSTVAGGAGAPLVRPDYKMANLSDMFVTGLRLYHDSWNRFIHSPVTFNLRIALLVILSCVAVQLTNAFILSAPLLLGRFICNSVGFTYQHSLYTVLVGLYALCISVYFGLRLHAFFSRHRFRFLLKVLAQYSQLACKCVILGVFWLFLIPIVLGVLVDLAIVTPLVVPLYHSPIYFLYQDWAIGLLSIKFCHKLLHSLPNSDDLPTYIQDWKVLIDHLETEGITGVSMKWAMGEVTWPAFTYLVALLCIPYVTIHSVLPSLGLDCYGQEVLYRYGYLVMTASVQMARWHCWFTQQMWKLHNTIRDDKYLVGKALRNMPEGTSPQNPITSASE